MKRKSPPAVSAIVEYWSVRQDECGLAVDWADAHERCWRCGYARRLQCCHIVPHALGGSNTPDNFVMLCVECHLENPNVADPDFMWGWLRSSAVPIYDTYWTIRAFDDFKKHFGREPNFGARDILPTDVLQEIFDKCTHHFGQPAMSQATRVWVLAEIEKRCLERTTKVAA